MRPVGGTRVRRWCRLVLCGFTQEEADACAARGGRAALEKALHRTLSHVQGAAFDDEVDGLGSEDDAPFPHGPRYTYTDADGSTGQPFSDITAAD